MHKPDLIYYFTDINYLKRIKMNGVSTKDKIKIALHESNLIPLIKEQKFINPDKEYVIISFDISNNYYNGIEIYKDSINKGIYFTYKNLRPVDIVEKNLYILN